MQDFQDVILSIKVSDAVSLFGMYTNFFVQCEDLSDSSLQSQIDVKKNAFDAQIWGETIEQHCSNIKYWMDHEMDTPNFPPNSAVSKSKKACMKKDVGLMLQENWTVSTDDNNLVKVLTDCLQGVITTNLNQASTDTRMQPTSV